MSSKVTLKIVVLGDSFVGKTSLINQFINRKYSCDYKATIGVDLSTRQISLENQIVNLTVWDPSGSERFRCVSDSFFRGTDGCVLVCSLTSSESLNSLDQWIEDLTRFTGKDIPFVAVANKADVDEFEWQITQNKFEVWATMKKFKCFLVSAKDATNVENAFFELAELALKNTKFAQQMQPFVCIVI
ncbi:hypothetical protein EIN_160940 [Entamoeba invadens IP1]|uniref:Uncharacterized protein n=1 Tax=Entamoeba invadens IP1 TaxID=370355 RepID=A0A0A1U4B8_ENTIV|nr:hypothetical protein EIN_160940 [Entamoeba invadens IP1]ELP86540.1 hypothetical protein EIN_160940 [Entamoeba invadens IP1]|eukprot:XP_004185886.1 hypothetical protein EIN_160940 [Entamoeba invadens IP1]